MTAVHRQKCTLGLIDSMGYVISMEHVRRSPAKKMSLLLKQAAVAVATVTALASSPTFGQRRALTMLDRLTDGQWELRFRGQDRSQVERICLHDGRKLIQLRHPEQPCDRLVVEDGIDTVTVQYTCRGRGYGRTRIRRETDYLVQVESQGIAGGLPFDFSAEGRRVGDCAS